MKLWKRAVGCAVVCVAAAAVAVVFFYATGQPSKPRAVVLMAGQSNMVGLAPNSGVEERRDHVLIRVGPGACCVPPREDAWRLLRLGESGCDPDTLGPEWGLADAFTDRFRKLLLVKHGVGATGIHDHWTPGTALFEGLVEAAQLALSEPHDLFLGLAWMQGETDSHDEDGARGYRRDFAHVVGNLSSRLARRVPVVAGHVQHAHPFFAMVNDALDAVADATIDTRAYTYLDGVHYDLTSTLALGRAFARALLHVQ